MTSIGGDDSPPDHGVYQDRSPQMVVDFLANHDKNAWDILLVEPTCLI